MSLQELREQALQLSVSDRLALMSTIIESLQQRTQTSPTVPKDIVDRMIGTSEKPMRHHQLMRS
jgi:hypothetical protein